MKKFLPCIIFLAFCFSCKKNQLGGKSKVSGKVTHHERIVPNATVYIKFNATEFPGADSSRYDAKVMADSHGEYSFRCYKGDYYLFGTGIDLQSSPLYVHGGVPVHVRNNEEVENDIAVSEHH
jgi:hypothetical protein